MALVLADRVQETSSTTGTGTLTLAGAVAGFQTFAAGIGAGNTCYYTIQSTTGAWEVGVGTVGAGTLARTTLISSSSGSFVSFTGTLTVFVTYPAEKAVYGEGAVIVAPSGALLPVASGGTGASTAGAALTNLGAQPAFGSQTANTVYAAPNGSAGAPSFRAIVAADVPTLNQNTTGTASNVTGIVAIANGGTGSSTATNARTALGLGTIATQDANSVAITGGAISGTSITVADNVFTLQDNLDATKQAQFQVSGVTTATTAVYNLPYGTANPVQLAALNVPLTFSSGQTFSAASSNFGTNTGASTYNFASGATTTGLTKTVNFGTGGLSGSTTAITVGATAGTSTTTMNGITNFLDTGFTLQDDADTTKQARFQLSGLVTATTTTYTLPAGQSGAATLADLSSAQTFSASKTFTGAANIFGSSSATYAVSLGVGATASGNTKTVNIGTAGASGSTTAITVGTNVSGSTSTTTLNGITKFQVYTVATLPSASTSGIGAKAFVSDALAPTFGATVATGGAVAVPVYSDGTNWKVG